MDNQDEDIYDKIITNSGDGGDIVNKSDNNNVDDDNINVDNIDGNQNFIEPDNDNEKINRLRKKTEHKFMDKITYIWSVLTALVTGIIFKNPNDIDDMHDKLMEHEEDLMEDLYQIAPKPVRYLAKTMENPYYDILDITVDCYKKSEKLSNKNARQTDDAINKVFGERNKKENDKEEDDKKKEDEFTKENGFL